MDMKQNATPTIGTEVASVHAVGRLTPMEMNARRLRSLAIACGLGVAALSIWALAVMRWSGMIAGSGS
jgi:hypothetical protein